jgi:hypothetical protein
MDKRPAGARGLTPGPEDDASLALYQSGSVVSRTLINNRTGTATLFVFDEGDPLIFKQTFALPDFYLSDYNVYLEYGDS